MSPHGKRCLKQLLRHEELTAALDALRGIPGLWGGMRLHTWNTILAIKCDDLSGSPSRRYGIAEDSTGNLALPIPYWGCLGEASPARHERMQHVDEVTVKALELRAPRVCTRDADEVRGQILGGTIFSAFGEEDRAGIWARVQAVDDLIPSLDALFENLKYLKVLADCMARLLSPLPGDTVSTALFKAFSDTNQRPDRAIIQVTESSFSSSPASSADGADLGVRQLFAYAMRHYLQMPRDLRGKELLARHTTNVDRPVLREFADLAEPLGFESPEITALKENPQMRDARNSSETSKPLLMTDGAGVKKKRRCGLPSVEEYTKDSESLFINHLHSVDDEQGEGLTSFVRKSIYSAFFGKPSSLSLEEFHPKDDAIEQGQELERQELERQERERQEREREEQARQELERQGLGRQKLDKQKQEKLDQEEKAKQKHARLAQTRKDHQERSQRLKLKRLHQEKSGGQAQEREEWEQPNLEDERRLGDQQRIGLDELLDIVQDVNPQPREDIQAESSGARLEETSDNTTVRINFKIRDGVIWKPVSTHVTERSDSSEIEKVAMKWVRKKWRLFNTELRMLAPQQCYDAAMTNGTYTILLMQESDINIDHEPLLSAMKIGIEAKERTPHPRSEKDLSEI